MTAHTDSIYTRYRTPALFLWWLLAAISFFVADRYSLSLGDDFGYMFADSRNHAADGGAVRSFADCLRAQTQQYFSTNGRFIVHLGVMSMLSLVPMWLYRVLNALMFATLWLLMYRLGYRRRYSPALALLLFALIWWTIPDSGVILLSLVSYSMNYLWPGVAVLSLIYLSRNADRLPTSAYSLLCLLALASGALQESYSIPLSAALAVDTIYSFRRLSRRHILLRILFLAGTAALIAAPGNLAHFTAGGAAEAPAMGHKFISMLTCLLWSPISVLALILAVWIWLRKRECKRFMRRNRIWLLSVAAAICFASVTYTAPRQLFAPSLFAIIVICRAILRFYPRWRRYSLPATAILLTFLCATFAGALFLRMEVKKSYDKFLSNFLQHPSSIAVFDTSDAPYNTSPLLWSIFGRYAPDPRERSHMSMAFDAFSRRGLSRIAFGASEPKAIRAILPMPSDSIIRRLPPQERTPDDNYTPRPIDSRYSAVTVRAPKPAATRTDAPHGSLFEQIYIMPEGILVTVVPASVHHIHLRYGPPSNKK